MEATREIDFTALE